MGRGRPKKINQKFFTESSSAGEIASISSSIGNSLPGINKLTLDALASISKSFTLMKSLQTNATLKGKGRGRRATIHAHLLFAECAILSEMQTGIAAYDALKKLGGWYEESQQSEVVCQSDIIRYAEAILDLNKAKMPGSYRQQIRQAMKYVNY